MGPRTVDTEFDGKVEELRQMAKQIDQVHRIYNDFGTHTAGTFNSDF
jgi:hypothetical protein